MITTTDEEGGSAIITHSRFLVEAAVCMRLWRGSSMLPRNLTGSACRFDRSCSNVCDLLWLLWATTNPGSARTWPREDLTPCFFDHSRRRQHRAMLACLLLLGLASGQVPSVAPTSAPTEHPCDDGSHQCWRHSSDSSEDATCVAMAGDAYNCQCLGHHTEISHYPHECEITPTKTPTTYPTPAPTPTPTPAPTDHACDDGSHQVAYSY